MQTFPGQGWNPSHSSDDAESLTARPPGNSSNYLLGVYFVPGSVLETCDSPRASEHMSEHTGQVDSVSLPASLTRRAESQGSLWNRADEWSSKSSCQALMGKLQGKNSLPPSAAL